MKTRSRAGSTADTDHALAAPTFADAGRGSHFQRNAPVRASKARTTPLGSSARLLSPIAEPTMTRSRRIAGGDVISYSPFQRGALIRSRSRFTSPFAPKSRHG